MISGCPESVITGVLVGESAFDDMVEEACAEGWTGHLRVHCSEAGVWDQPTESCGEG